jgi:hypothetical protein
VRDISRYSIEIKDVRNAIEGYWSANGVLQGPVLREDATMKECVVLLAEKRGTVPVVDAARHVVGVVTAGVAAQPADGAAHALHRGGGRIPRPTWGCERP